MSAAPELPTGLTARAVEAVEADPRRADLPREASLSWPVPFVVAGRPHLVFFWASQGGPANRRTMSAPYALTRVDPQHPDGAVFERLAAGALNVAADAVLRPTIGGSVGMDERRAVATRFHAMTDAVMALYAGQHEVVDTAAARSLDAYRQLFDRITVTDLRPAYEALNPHFFQWLGRATGSSMQDKFHANAELVRQVARDDLGVEVDYDEAGVRWLDRYIDSQRAAATEAVKASLPSTLGSFLGECIRHRFGGEWQHDPAGWMVRVDQRVSVFPFNKVRKQLENDQGDSVLGLFNSIPALRAETTTNWPSIR